MPGPVPNRTTDLSRERDANRGGRPPITKGELRPVVDVLAPDEEWHPIAKHLYLSLAASGQSDFYQVAVANAMLLALDGKTVTEFD